MTDIIWKEVIKKHPGLAKRAKNEPMAAIRMKCLDCSANQPGEVKNCCVNTCFLHPFRLGIRPRTLAKKQEGTCK